MSDREITDLLARSGDDRDRPLRTDPGELLLRARRDTVRRRRVRGAASLLVAAAIVAGVVLVPRLVSGSTTPVAPRPTTAALSAATVVQRCRPQLAKYAGVTGYAADPVTADWHLSHEGWHYRAGELVQLAFAGGDVGRSVLCVVPTKGHEQDPVGFDRLTPTAGDVDLLRAVCAEQANEVGDGGVRIPDLRRATVLATSFSGKVAGALLRGPDGHLYGCATGSPTWDPSFFDLGRVATSSLVGTFSEFGVFTSSSVGQPGARSTVAVLAGTVARPTGTLELTLPGRSTRTFPIENGYVAAAARWNGGAGGGSTPRVLVRTPNGRVLTLPTD